MLSTVMALNVNWQRRDLQHYKFTRVYGIASNFSCMIDRVHHPRNRDPSHRFQLHNLICVHQISVLLPWMTPTRSQPEEHNTGESGSGVCTATG